MVRGERILLLLSSNASFFCFRSFVLVLRSSPSFNGWFFLNPPLLGDCLPPFDISTRPGRLETVSSRLISYVGLSQIPILGLVIHSDHSEIIRVFSSSWYNP
jgi:hypothetical protein